MNAACGFFLPPIYFQFAMVLLVLFFTIFDTTASSDNVDMIETSNISQKTRIVEILELTFDKQCEEENEGSFKLDTFKFWVLLLSRSTDTLII